MWIKTSTNSDLVKNIFFYLLLFTIFDLWNIFWLDWVLNKNMLSKSAILFVTVLCTCGRLMLLMLPLKIITFQRFYLLMFRFGYCDQKSHITSSLTYQLGRMLATGMIRIQPHFHQQFCVEPRSGFERWDHIGDRCERVRRWLEVVRNAPWGKLMNSKCYHCTFKEGCQCY